MKRSDLKYLLAYLTPITAWLGLYYKGIYAPGSFYLAFIIIPLLELFFQGNTENIDPKEESSRASDKFFTALLYLNLPIFYGLLIYFFYIIYSIELSTFEYFALTLNMGIVGGTLGINIAHELGHRSHWYDQLISKSLLLPCLYLHFNIEHNRGHHKYVATPQDPATARYGENFYSFFIRSVKDSYISAWKLERERLVKIKQPFMSFNNQMILFQLIQAIYLITIAYFLGAFCLFIALCFGIVSFLLLEAINYIEHYGLLRKEISIGVYERVNRLHSWNSNHELGR
ncbi:MAG: alkane 1-monooxygenase, partial [Saprospiraceae bacterium]